MIPCASCPAGKYQNATGASDCKACVTGGTSPEGSTSQTDCVCDAGYYGDGITRCKACTPGWFAETAGSAQCAACPAGSYAAASGAIACASCPVGKYQNATGASDCKACPAHSNSTAGSAACACDASYYGDGITSCQACVTGGTSPEGSTSQTDCVCDAGYYGDGITYCNACAPGTYAFPTSVTCSGPCECVPSLGPTSGTISDGPGDYPNNANCEWLIAAPGAVSLTFSAFNTESGWDYVSVNECTSATCSDKTQLAKLHGTQGNGQTYSSSTGYLQVVLTSDGSSTHVGSGVLGT